MAAQDPAPITLAVLFVALLAGCAQPSEVAAEGPAAVDLSTSVIETGPAVGPDLDATTAEAPRLVEGEWWRIRFDGAIYATEPLLRVVANATEDGYVFGMPHEAWMKEAIVYHAPAFGDVGRDLSYDVHNERFEPLHFPLVQGATWDTVFAATPMTATVESADEKTATIRFDPPPAGNDPTTTVMGVLVPLGDMGTMRLTYDARMHEIVKMESALGSWEVVEHGYEFRGWVSVPTGAHTAIDYGTFGPDTANPLPSRTVHVDESFNRITLLHAVFAVSPGVYRVTSKAPTGESFVTEVVGKGEFRFGIYEVGNPGGDWTQEDIAVGVGGTYTMGIAYQQYDILVPEGARRPTHGHEVFR